LNAAGDQFVASRTGFRFQSTVDIPSFNNPLVGVVPIGLSGTKDLLQAVADALQFPGYFGHNWNALYDCLRDFHWPHQKDVVLIHSDLPALDGDDLKIYLEILQEASLSWKPDESHTFIAVFDPSLKHAILSVLQAEPNES
jgi:molybdopterin-guanine dinucleotide biosynthesis protein A